MEVVDVDFDLIFVVVFLWLSLALKSLPFFQLNYDVILNVYGAINLEEGEEGRKDYWMREEFDISIWKVWLYSVQVQAGSTDIISSGRAFFTN